MDPAVILSMLMLSFIFCDSMCFLVEVNLCMFLYRHDDKGGVWILLTGLTLPHCCACSKPGAGFPTSYVVIFFFYVQ
jgi:hypothetical protein